MYKITILKKNLSKHPNISSLITENDLDNWTAKLSGYENPYDEYISKTKYNLLTILILENCDDCSKNLINLLEGYLTVFPELMTSSEFRKNIKNLENSSFLSFLSELSFAKYLVDDGFKLSFNTGYHLIKKHSLVPRDIDIEAIKDNLKFYFEVYTPFDQVELDGFFDVQSLVVNDLLKKVKIKEYDKFNLLAPDQLNGKIILAVNTIYVESYSIQQTVNVAEYFHKIENAIHKEIDGILLFTHDLARESKLSVNQIFLKGQ